MDQRRALAYRVLAEGRSLSQAAREFGVSRPTARLWVGRAEQDGLGGLSERSRRPLSCSFAVAEEAAQLLLDEKAKYPVWGAKKLLARLWPPGGAPLSLRSANRVLSRNGLSCPRQEARPADGRFERDGANELWQMDFKGLKYPRLPYEALSVIDDSTRFCLGLVPLKAQSTDEVWGALWDLFGSYGLPDCVLSDNGPAFRSGAGRLVSTLDARLLRVGVRSSHGRPYHPQTQGKVERFHGTLERELGAQLRQPCIEDARRVYEAFRSRYNWERPHEAIGLKAPGWLYESSVRKRPERLPKHELAEGAVSRKVDGWGNFGVKGKRYKVGRGLAGERVELRETPDGELAVLFFGAVLGALNDFEV